MAEHVVSILERPVYGIGEAARVLGLGSDRVRAWLDGYERRGVLYRPVIRVEPTGSEIVTRPLAMVISTGQAVALADEAARFFKKVEFDRPEDGDVCRIHPAGMASPVVIDPLVRFGRPTVRGVATERLWELHDAGETVDEIAEGYELEPELVRRG